MEDKEKIVIKKGRKYCGWISVGEWEGWQKRYKEMFLQHKKCLDENERLNHSVWSKSHIKKEWKKLRKKEDELETIISCKLSAMSFTNQILRESSCKSQTDFDRERIQLNKIIDELRKMLKNEKLINASIKEKVIEKESQLSKRALLEGVDQKYLNVSRPYWVKPSHDTVSFVKQTEHGLYPDYKAKGSDRDVDR